MATYISERNDCLNNTGSTPEQKKAYEGEPPAGHFRSEQPELRHLHILQRMLPIPHGFDCLLSGKHSLLRETFEKNDASFCWYRGTQLGDPDCGYGRDTFR